VMRCRRRSQSSLAGCHRLCHDSNELAAKGEAILDGGAAAEFGTGADALFHQHDGHAALIPQVIGCVAWSVIEPQLATRIEAGAGEEAGRQELRALGGELSWQMVLLWISVVAAAGGCLLALLVPDGPHLPKSGPFRARGIVDIFAGRAFRAAAFGYFGHMWELYAFWAFVPVIWEIHATCRRMVLDLPLYSFAVIAVGFLGCAGGGLISLRLGSARVAAAQLTVSGACCLLSPLAFGWPTPVFVAFMLVWGITVIGDSPQFSALTAATAPRQLVGTALTTVTCIGFSLTIVSIQLLHFLHGILPDRLLILPLAAGPAAGLLALRRLLRP